LAVLSGYRMGSQRPGQVDYRLRALPGVEGITQELLARPAAGGR
jgi:hypothetical protein